MANLEKLYQSVAENIVQRCHGAIKITKHGKIIEVYDTRRHIWSDGLAGLIIKEESKNANLRDWEVARCIRPRIISMLLEDKKDYYRQDWLLTVQKIKLEKDYQRKNLLLKNQRQKNQLQRNQLEENLINNLLF